MHLQPNTLLQGGKYRIARFISSGGFGCTYEAEHVMLRKRLAIKEFFVKDFCNRDEATGHISVGTQSKAALVERLMRKFIDEAVALSQMNHPHIVRVSDVFAENNSAYYVMDYIDGCSLDEMVKQRGRLSEEEALVYIRQAAEALDYVHAQNRLHLDIKPGNIMVDSNGQAILIDFGVSKQYDSVEGENTSTLLGKTPGYAPIEQMGNSVQQFTPATDIYALGATLYKLLSGTTPPESTVIINDGIPELDGTISQKTREAVYKSMEFRRIDRPQTIKEFLALLPTENIDGHAHIRENKDTSSTSKMEAKNSDEETIIIGRREEPTLADENKLSHGTCNGHEWVDLGLSVKWATCNVGANSPEEYGDYLNWEKGLDTVQEDWAATWRLPTQKEFDELKNLCEWTWGKLRGTYGYKVTGKNGNSIFLPAGGRYCFRVTFLRTQKIDYDIAKSGCYWTSTMNEVRQSPYRLHFDKSGKAMGWISAVDLLTIRPVTD